MRAFSFLAGVTLFLVAGCEQAQNLGGGVGGGAASGTANGGVTTGSGGAYDPCEGKSCGDECSLCAPNDLECAETAIVKSCDGAGECKPLPEVDCAACTYGGVTYQDGDSFPAADGCNTCTCDNGSVGCTEIGCPTPCDGIQTLLCPPGEYCKHDGGTCGLYELLGQCEPMPMACDTVLDPVCGCNGVTYGNACEAAAAGNSIAHDGACEAEPCGGIAGTPCASSEYCKLPDGTCGDPDVLGGCEAVPSACPDNVDPVCGCDGVTYFNACEAAAASMSIDHAGPCGQCLPAGAQCNSASDCCSQQCGQGACL